MTHILLQSGALCPLDISELETFDLLLEDVVRGLELIPRFRGIGTPQVDVAWHSIHVADLAKSMVSDGLKCFAKLSGLLHDADEVVVGDIPSPVRKYILSEDAKEWLEAYGKALKMRVLDSLRCETHWYRRRPEEPNWWVHTRMMKKLDDPEVVAAVHQADLIAMATEKRDTLPVSAPWPFTPPPPDESYTYVNLTGDSYRDRLVAAYVACVTTIIFSREDTEGGER